MFGISSNLVNVVGGRGFRAATTLAGKLGAEISGKIGDIFGNIGGRIGVDEYRILEAQLEFAKLSAPALNGIYPKNLYRGVFRHIGKSIAELSHFTRLLEPLELGNNPRYKHIEASDSVRVIRDLIGGHSPALLMSGHIGNFELLAAYYTRSGLPLTIVGRAPNYEFLSRWLEELRVGYGAEALFRSSQNSSKRDVAGAFIKAFKNNRAVGVLLDQDTALESEYAPFFSLDAAHPVTPLRLAIRGRIRLISTFIVRTGESMHRVFAEEIEYDPESKTAARDILTIYSARLQKLVESYPEQYLWFHRRWRRRPADERPANLGAMKTSQYIEWIKEQQPR